ISVLPFQKTGPLYLVFDANTSDHINFSPSSSGVYFALKDHKGNFFCPSYDGVMFSRDFIKWQRALFYPGNRALLIDAKNDLWVGTRDDGVVRIRYDYLNDTPHLKTMDRFLPGIGIRALYQDSKGYVWIGSRYNGIYRLNPADIDTSKMLHFGQFSGLTSNRINSIGEDKWGCIWLDYSQGLDKLIPTDESYRVFNFSRCHNFFANITEMMFDKDHSLWLATTQGVVNISDGNLENIKPLNVYITTASLGDSIYRDEINKKITLSYRHKQVQFEFAAPGFINEKQVEFSYRLVGGNNTNWSQPSNEHSVSYANLQPGSYRFEVRNKGWNGEWGKATSFEFLIRPPFWQTWWFVAAVALVAGAAIYWMVKRRIEVIRKEGELKQKIAETEMMALRA